MILSDYNAWNKQKRKRNFSFVTLILGSIAAKFGRFRWTGTPLDFAFVAV